MPHYKRFVQAIGAVVIRNQKKKYAAVKIELNDLKPLAIFKQIMTMFCIINNGCFGDDELRRFLLEKDNKTFNKKKYRVFMYLNNGNVERENGLTVIIRNAKSLVCVSEIVSFPVGYSLYLDLPEDHEPEGIEITSLVDYDYGIQCDLQLFLDRLGINTPYPEDYRTEEEVLASISKHKKR